MRSTSVKDNTDPAILARAVPDMVFRVDASGTYLGFKTAPGMEPFVPARTFLGKTVAEVLPESVARLALEAIRAAVRSGDAQRIEFDLPEADGTRHYDCWIVPNGKEEVFAFSRDVTERWSAQQALLSDVDELRRILDDARSALELAAKHLPSDGEADLAASAILWRIYHKRPEGER